MLELIDRQAALEVAMRYCPDDDGSCSKSGHDIREMLDEIEALPIVHIDDMAFNHECRRQRRQSGMSARKKRKQRVGNTCGTCRFYNVYAGTPQCYYDFQDEVTTSAHNWCANYLPRGTAKTSHLIDAPNGRCCAACGYTPIKQDGNACPLCGRTWEGGADNDA